MIVCLSPNGSNVHTGANAPTQLLVGTADGLAVLVRRDTRASWQATGHRLPGLHVSSLLHEPRHGGLFAGIHEGGLYFSADDGLNWERRMNGLTNEHIFCLRAVNEPERVVLYAGTEPAGLFSSRDYGETWHELPALRDVPNRDKWNFPPPPHIAHTKTLAFDPRDPLTFCIGVEQGALLKTTDGGRSLRELEGYSSPDDTYYRDVHQVVLRPTNPDEILMTTGMGLYYSPNAGESWEHLTGLEFRIGYPDQLIFSPTDDRTFFMSGAATTPNTWRRFNTARATVMRSRDVGRTWEPAGQGFPTEMRGNIEAMSIATYPKGFVLFAGTTDGDVFESVDGAESWHLIASGLAAVSKVGHYRNLLGAAT